MRRGSFVADRFVVARKTRKSERAGEIAAPLVHEVCTVIEVFVHSNRVKFSDVFIRFKLELAIYVVVVTHGEIAAFDKVPEVPQATFDFVAVATHLQIFEVNFVRLDRNAITPVVKGVTKREPAFAGKPACAAAYV